MSEQLTLHHFSFAELHLDGPAPARDLFARLQAQPWAMLLESASAQHPDSRFDIISADPVATVVTEGATTRIEYPGTHRPARVSTDDPLQLLQQTSSALLGAPPYAGELPFIGGAIGLFGYDLGRRFERLPVLSQADITVPDMAQGIYDWAWILDKAHRQATLLVQGDETAWQQRWLWWQQQQTASLTPCRLTTQWQANMDEAGYRQRFARIQAYLAAGDCYQINLTQRFCAGYQGSEWEAYCRLSSGNAAPFSAFLRLPHAAILSLSPERFLSLEGARVSTKPIKGTRPRHSEAAADAAAAEALRQADKDRAENLMIVDLLRNDIGRVCIPGTVRVPSLFAVESFPAVHHLVSTIEGELPSTLTATDLLRACFPGGSITGAPKIRAMEIIEELEPQRRNAYCGSIGYLSRHGRMDTSITIRTLIACQQTLYVWAGGGIVADSRVEAEYQETFDKLGRILPLLANNA
ncbi:aminodeoxychorismate synthase component I [Pseudaeromonas sharmana]|uniref:aminodeoxychorismate synthase n=1 Tax=Pseudaeromonas sharmana TaxID=328412 RepID=A0ABV8CQ67_9GAMM